MSRLWSLAVRRYARRLKRRNLGTYVVEKTDEGCYQVLPIANPVHVAAKWILCGESWRMVAEEAKVVASPPY